MICSTSCPNAWVSLTSCPRALRRASSEARVFFDRVEQVANTAGQFRQSSGEVGQVLKQKAIVRQLLDNQVQKHPVVFRLKPGVRWRIEQRRKFCLKPLEQTQNQGLLAMKVVIQIAGADAHFIGDFQRRDVWLALLVEQRQRALKDTVASFHPVFLFKSQSLGLA